MSAIADILVCSGSKRVKSLKRKDPLVLRPATCNSNLQYSGIPPTYMGGMRERHCTTAGCTAAAAAAAAAGIVFRCCRAH